MKCKECVLLLYFYLFIFCTAINADIFYVFSASPKNKNYFVPTGYMGDASDINISASNKVLTIDGYPSLKLVYKPKGEQKWIGVYFQYPANNWGQYKGGYDLRGAKKLVFYARGETGGEIITSVGCGGIKGKNPDSDILQVGPVKLTNEWKKFTINLYGKDLKYISGGFFFIIETKDNPLGCTIYFGDIYYEGEKISAVEIFEDTIPPKVKLAVSDTKFLLNPVQNEIPNVKFNIFCDDNKYVSNWELKILNQHGKTVKSFTGTGKTEQSLIWDFKDEVYLSLVPEGEYKVLLTATDESNNTSSAEEKIVVEHVKPEPVKITETKVVPQEVKIIEEEKSLRVRLQSQVLFETGKWELLPHGKNTLLNVVELLKSYPDNKIVVEGHTDSVGSEEYNMKLSYNRANAVKNFLVENGISEERIELKAYGETKPIASNKTKTGRALNRRVEILILK